MHNYYVKNSNHHLFADMLEAVQSRAAREGRMILLVGDPGLGKSRCVDFIGAENNAIYINGMPGMTSTYTRDLLCYELGVQGNSMFEKSKGINKEFSLRKPMVILDEAQHGLGKKADCIEYLRRVCEEAGSTFILVCHTSERSRFSENKLAHIASRISGVVEFKPAGIDDTRLYFKELCQIKVDEQIAQQALKQSGGRYRLLTNAVRTVEDLAEATGKTSLIGADTHGMMLCEDAMRSLRKGRNHG